MQQIVRLARIISTSRVFKSATGYVFDAGHPTEFQQGVNLSFIISVKAFRSRMSCSY